MKKRYMILMFLMALALLIGAMVKEASVIKVPAEVNLNPENHTKPLKF